MHGGSVFSLSSLSYLKLFLHSFSWHLTSAWMSMRTNSFPANCSVKSVTVNLTLRWAENRIWVIQQCVFVHACMNILFPVSEREEGWVKDTVTSESEHRPSHSSSQTRIPVQLSQTTAAAISAPILLWCTQVRGKRAIRYFLVVFVCKITRVFDCKLGVWNQAHIDKIVMD